MSKWHVVPEEWKPRLRAYLYEKYGEERERLSAHDFRCNESVHLQFEDGSYAWFQFAFVIFDERSEECMVFTEHCGYHVFPVGENGVRVHREIHATQNHDDE